MLQKLYKTGFTIIALSWLTYLGYRLNLPEWTGRCIPEEISLLVILILCRFVMDPDKFQYSLRGCQKIVLEKLEKRVGFEYQAVIIPNAKIHKNNKEYVVVAGRSDLTANNTNFLSIATGIYDIHIEQDTMSLVRRNSSGRIAGNIIYTLNLAMVALMVNIGWNDYLAGDMSNARAIPMLLALLELIIIFVALASYFIYPGRTVRKYMKEIIDLAEEESLGRRKKPEQKKK